MKCFLFILTAASTLTSCSSPYITKLSSPNGKIEILFALQEGSGALLYHLLFEGQEVIEKSRLGMHLGDNQIPLEIKRLIPSQETMVDTTWKPVYGEKNSYRDHFRQINMECTTSHLNIDGLILQVRAYDEGVAFRYLFDINDSIEIREELTEFNFPANTRVWSSTTAQGPISKSPVEDLNEAVERPLLAELNDSLFIAIGEAALTDFARLKLKSKKSDPSTLLVALSSTVSFEKSFESPWRFIMVERSPGLILENNHLILNLNKPSSISDTRWIQPGKVIREVTLTTRGGVACVDFAVKHNLQFVEFDAGWYGPENDEASDATTVSVDPKRSKGPLDLHKVIAYAKSKNIGIILYVNRRALEKQLNEILPLYQSWGVKGIKYGFVNVGSQHWTTWLHQAVAQAAEHELMIDIHDEYRPTGVSRTYPNLMTQEGIRGDEESPTNAMVLNTLFTRMIAGAGDHTNCYFSKRVKEQMGSHASQMAKAICIYSPWQFVFWYDRPPDSPSKVGGAGQNQRHIIEIPELSFYDHLPTVWDNSKIISGYPGEHAIVARRSGSSWFLAALNGDNDREFTISLDFLDAGKTYQMTLYEDTPRSAAGENVKSTVLVVDKDKDIRRMVRAQGGFAAIIRKN